MREKIAKNSLVIMGITFIVGLILIFSSALIGESFGKSSIEPWNSFDYQRIIISNTENFRMGGLVISLVGGLGSLLSGYALYNEIDKNSLG